MNPVLVTLNGFLLLLPLQYVSATLTSMKVAHLPRCTQFTKFPNNETQAKLLVQILWNIYYSFDQQMCTQNTTRMETNCRFFSIHVRTHVARLILIIAGSYSDSTILKCVRTDTHFVLIYRTFIVSQIAIALKGHH